MAKMNQANQIWRDLVGELCTNPQYRVSPRGMQISEILAAQYEVDMPAFLDLDERKVNVPFMLAEAAWILSGRNDLAYIKQFLPGYARFSDEGTFMNGAYGPKVVDQLPYVVTALMNDRDSRQAVINIWREKPGPSKDIPCTTGMQFFIRSGKLNAVVTMRSQDIVLGFTYDIFTFSMVANAVRLLYNEQNASDELENGTLVVTVGSLHLYDDYYDRAERWASSRDRNGSISTVVGKIVSTSTNYTMLVNNLIKEASRAKKTV